MLSYEIIQMQQYMIRHILRILYYFMYCNQDESIQDTGAIERCNYHSCPTRMWLAWCTYTRAPRCSINHNKSCHIMEYVSDAFIQGTLMDDCANYIARCQVTYWISHSFIKTKLRWEISYVRWWDKMDAIFHTTYWNAFSWMNMCKFRLTFHWTTSHHW